MKTQTAHLNKLIKKRDSLAAKLSGCKHILRGTIVKQGNVCGKRGCRCKRKDKPILHGPYDYLSHRSRTGINMIFLTRKKLFIAKAGVLDYNKAIDLIYRISEINFEILRYHHAELSDE